MKYTAQFNAAAKGYIVKIGRAKKNGDVRYTGTVYSSEAEAQRNANAKNGEFMINELRKLVRDMPLADAKSIGYSANVIIDDVTDRCEEEDPSWDAHDGRGWLA